MLKMLSIASHIFCSTVGAKIQHVKREHEIDFIGVHWQQRKNASCCWAPTPIMKVLETQKLKYEGVNKSHAPYL